MIKCRVGRGYEEGSSKRRDALQVFVCVFFVWNFVGTFGWSDFCERIFCCADFCCADFSEVFWGQGDRRENDEKIPPQNPSPKSSPKSKDVYQSVLT